MLNAKRVFADTPKRTRESAGTDCIKVTYSVQPKKDPVFGRPYASVLAGVKRNPPKGSGMIHKVEFRMYDEQSMNADIWASCDCGSWTYRAEITWSTKGSSDVIYTKDHPTLPYIRNPKGLVWACPHVLHIMSYALFDKRVKDAIEQAKLIEKDTVVEDEKLKAPKKPAKKAPAKKKSTSKKKAPAKKKKATPKKKAPAKKKKKK
jgi:hypothetical protein